MNIYQLGFTLLAIYIVANIFPTPKEWWEWRIVEDSGTYYLQSRGVLKPWWHNVLNEYEFPIQSENKEEIESLLRRLR